MTKKGLALLLALVLLSAAALLGLTGMTDRMKHQRQEAAVYVTATPPPTDE